MTPAQSALEWACQQLVATVRLAVVCNVPASVIAVRVAAVATEVGVILGTTEGDDGP